MKQPDAKRLQRFAAPIARIRDGPEPDDTTALAREEEEPEKSGSSSERRHGRPTRASTGRREPRRSTSGSRERYVPPPQGQG